MKKLNRYSAFCVLWLSASLSQAALVTVPGALENVEGPDNNIAPFDLQFFSGSGMRYQQVYSSSEFNVGGIIDQIRFRLDKGFGASSPIGASFSTSGIDIRIDLAYAATTVATTSSIFANNIGGGLVTVLDTPNLSLSGTNVGAGFPNPFDIIIDVDNLFNYDPTMGDLLVDIYMRNNPTTSAFDAISSTPAMSRIFSFGSTSTVNDISGINAIGSGLVTQFQLQAVPVPAAVWLFGSGLIGLIGFAKRKT